MNNNAIMEMTPCGAVWRFSGKRKVTGVVLSAAFPARQLSDTRVPNDWRGHSPPRQYTITQRGTEMKGPISTL